MRAAASSMASGRPSRSLTISDDGASLRVVRREVVPHRSRAGHEKIDRGTVERQGLDGLHDLAGDVESLPARDHERGVGRVQPASDGGGRVLRDLLEVVEDDQAAAASRNRLGQLRSGIATAEAHAERARRRVVDAFERRRIGQITEPDSSGPFAERAMAIPDGQASLAGAAGPQQGQQPRAFAEMPGDRRQVRRAPDERVGLGGEKCRMSRTGCHSSPRRTTRYDLSLSEGGTKLQCAVRPISKTATGSSMPLRR